MSNLALRIISALILIPLLLILLFFSSPPIFSVVVVLVSALCGYEFGTMTLGDNFRKMRFFTSLITATITAGIAYHQYSIYYLLVPLSVAAVVGPLLFMFLDADFSDSVKPMAFTMSSFLYIGVPFGLVCLLFSNNEQGGAWVFALCIGAFLGDTLAYVFGRLFGKHKLSPRISPKKTWEGSFGSLLGTTLGVGLTKLIFLQELSYVDVVLLSVPLNIFCQIGDLCESFIKRGVGIKDSGNIIPGHGGLLDRVDALIFGAPVIFFFSVWR